jgi:hypothetical protein
MSAPPPLPSLTATYTWRCRSPWTTRIYQGENNNTIMTSSSTNSHSEEGRWLVCKYLPVSAANGAKAEIEDRRGEGKQASDIEWRESPGEMLHSGTVIGAEPSRIQYSGSGCASCTASLPGLSRHVYIWLSSPLQVLSQPLRPGRYLNTNHLPFHVYENSKSIST